MRLTYETTTHTHNQITDYIKVLNRLQNNAFYFLNYILTKKKKKKKREQERDRDKHQIKRYTKCAHMVHSNPIAIIYVEFQQRLIPIKIYTEPNGQKKAMPYQKLVCSIG